MIHCPVTRSVLASLSLFFVVLPAAADDPGWGGIKGRIVLNAAAAPEPQPINVTNDQNHCLSKGPIFKEDLVVNKTNLGVRWVFVWLAPGSGGQPLAVHPNLKAIKNKQVEIDQPCCAFVPHALAIRQGQELVARNSSPVGHNVNWTGHPLKNPGGNVIVPAGKSQIISDLRADRFPVKVACNIHGWMSAWVRVFDHPYFAVTDLDGRFEIKVAPAGAFRLVIWHESGWGPGGRDGLPVVISAGQTTDQGDLKMQPPQ